VPALLPPIRSPGQPRKETLAVGSVLFRVHRDRFGATVPAPATARGSGPGGSRFDSPDGSFAVLYVAGDHQGALAETICRDLPLTAAPRIIPRSRLTGRMLTRLVSTVPLTFVTAHGAALAHLGQDEWLTSCAPAGYPLTRQWAAAIRRWAPDADGIAYRCRRDADRTAYLLWTDPGAVRHPALEESWPVISLTEPLGITIARRVAQLHTAVLSR